MMTQFRKQIGDTFAAVLKPAGFKKSGLTWQRDREEFIDAVDVQFSRWSDEFAVNIGVIVPKFRAQLFDKYVSPRLAANGAVESRLGALASNGFDVWWDRNSIEQINEARQSLIDFGLPFLDRHHSFSEMIVFLEKKDHLIRRPVFPHSYYLALLYIEAGRKEEGCNIFRTMMQKSSDPWTKPAHRLMKVYCEKP